MFTAVAPKGAYLNKSELLNNFCAETGLDRKQGRMCFDSLTSIGQGELQRGRMMFLNFSFHNKLFFKQIVYPPFLVIWNLKGTLCFQGQTRIEDRQGMT